MAAGLLALSIGAAGCGSELKTNPEAYRGPELRSEIADSAYLLVAQAPTPGWDVEIDATRRGADRTDVFVTLRRPNPVAAYSSKAVMQRVLTRVSTDRPLGILARVMPFGSDEDQPYHRVRTDEN